MIQKIRLLPARRTTLCIMENLHQFQTGYLKYPMANSISGSKRFSIALTKITKWMWVEKEKWELDVNETSRVDRRGLRRKWTDTDCLWRFASKNDTFIRTHFQTKRYTLYIKKNLNNLHIQQIRWKRQRDRRKITRIPSTRTQQRIHRLLRRWENDNDNDSSSNNNDHDAMKQMNCY